MGVSTGVGVVVGSAGDVDDGVGVSVQPTRTPLIAGTPAGEAVQPGPTGTLVEYRSLP